MFLKFELDKSIRRIKNFILEPWSNKIENDIKQKYKDYYIFMPLACIGDLLIVFQRIKTFKEKYGKKVVILVRDKERQELAKCFPSIDEAVIIPKIIFMYWLYHRPLTLSLNPQVGIPHLINSSSSDYKIKFKNQNDLYTQAIGLNSEEIKTIEKPVISTKNIDELNKIWNNLGLSDKTILLSPYSASLDYKVLSKKFWLNLANEYTKQGYDVIFNSPKKDFKNYKTLFLPLVQMFLLADKCQKLIMFRSGLVDLIASYKSDNIITIYPKTMDHLTLGIAQRDIWKKTYNFDESISYEENMYKVVCLEACIGKHSAKEIIFDGNEEKLIQTLIAPEGNK